MAETRQIKRHGHMGGGRHMMPGEKAKDFRGTMKKLLEYLGSYKIAILFVMIFAVGGTAFNIIGPKILGNATTEIFNGLVSRVSGGDGIDFGKVGRILLSVLALYLVSAVLSFIQGYIMTGISQKMTYRLRKEISEKIGRMPMKYFDRMTHGEILSRITNDVDNPGTEPEPERHPGDHLRDHHHRCPRDDAQHQPSDDGHRHPDPSPVHVPDLRHREALTAVLQGSAGIPGPHQRPGGRGVQRTQYCQGI